jgi:anti-anti-sigma regulatory factor/anti-sigma regulatory factor (Ser/Thr protein kinase)
MLDQLVCQVEREHPEALVRVSGVLDLNSSTTLRQTLLKCLASEPRAVIVDLSEARITDDLALTLFPSIDRHAAAWPGCDVILAAPSEDVTAALERTAVGRYIRVCPSVDAAMMLGERPTSRRRHSTVLDPVPSSASVARNFVDEVCRCWQLHRLSPNAQLIATELVSNSIRHARTAMELIVSLRSRYLHVSVRDRSVVMPMRRAVDLYGEGGRGLFVVENLSASWGSIPTLDGKVVWATLRHASNAVR